MFVHNVRVRWDQQLRVPGMGQAAGASAASAAAALAAASDDAPADEVYQPVECALCATEVAVHDRDEVFHFFNVIADAPL